MPETDHLKTPGRSNWNRFLGPTATATMRNKTHQPIRSVFDSNQPRIVLCKSPPTNTNTALVLAASTAPS